MAKVPLYHGTAKSFGAFDDHFAARGTEPNCALGIHLTERPDLAAEYARMATADAHAGEAVVLVVEADVSRVGLISDVADFLGRNPEVFDPETNRSREDFVARRHELEDQGFDAVATGEMAMDDISGCWVVFSSARLTIKETISLEAAEEIESDPHFPNVDFEEVTLFESEAPVP